MTIGYYSPSTMTCKRFFLGFGCAAALTVGLAACGTPSVPSADVALVGDEDITKAQFDRWFSIAGKSQAQAPGQKSPPPPKPGTPQYTQLKDQVMGFLINAAWTRGEAEELGISADQAAVEKKFAEIKKQFFPKKNDYNKFLKQSGQVQADLFFRVETQLLADDIRAKITKGADSISDSQIEDYYEKNKKTFEQPERRDLRAVLSKDKDQADKAKAAVDGGMSVKAASKKYSTDAALKQSGGVLQGITRGQNDKALDDAAFSAQSNQVVGPIKTQFGYYVFEVTKIVPQKVTPLDQAKQQIKQTLVAQEQQKLLDGFIKKFTEEWKDKTVCAKGYIVPQCKNAVKPKTTATPAQQPKAPPGGHAPLKGDQAAQGGQGGAMPPQGGAGGGVPMPQQQGVPPQAGGAQQVPQQVPQSTPPSGR